MHVVGSSASTASWSACSHRIASLVCSDCAWSRVVRAVVRCVCSFASFVWERLNGPRAAAVTWQRRRGGSEADTMQRVGSEDGAASDRQERAVVHRSATTEKSAHAVVHSLGPRYLVWLVVERSEGTVGRKGTTRKKAIRRHTRTHSSPEQPAEHTKWTRRPRQRRQTVYYFAQKTHSPTSNDEPRTHHTLGIHSENPLPWSPDPVHCTWLGLVVFFCFCSRFRGQASSSASGEHWQTLRHPSLFPVITRFCRRGRIRGRSRCANKAGSLKTRLRCVGLNSANEIREGRVRRARERPSVAMARSDLGGVSLQQRCRVGSGGG